MKAIRCDACERRIRRNQHTLRLSDPLTRQPIGSYHTRSACQEAATKYMTSGAVLIASIIHPDRCGEDQAHCDAGLSEGAA
jgi:hypothetical protein